MFIDNPINLGYETADYDLPELDIKEIVVDADQPMQEVLTLTERRNARKESLIMRCREAADIIASTDEQFVVWCDLNAEQDKLAEFIADNVSIQGSTSNKLKIEREREWREGKHQTLITKPLCFGYGMNWQHCHNMIFTGLSDSYEQYYQALRRCWRFGQNSKVNVYIIISAKEGCVKQNIERKESDFRKMQAEMIKYTKEVTKKELRKTCRISTPYTPGEKMELPKWEEFINECNNTND